MARSVDICEHPLSFVPRAARPGMASLHPLDEAVELMFYGHRGIVRDADNYLTQFGLAHAHLRIMYILARHDGINIGDLVSALGISKQAVQRPLKTLLDEAVVAVSRDPSRHRYKALHLTQRGREIEHEASELKRALLAKAFAGDDAATQAWTRIMRAIAENA